MPPDTHAPDTLAPGIAQQSAVARAQAALTAALDHVLATQGLDTALRQANALAADDAPAPLVVALADWRRRAYHNVRHAPPRAVWPPVYADPFPGQAGVPEIKASDLSPEILGGAIIHHGSLIVRGLITPGQAEAFRENAARGIEARARHKDGAPVEQTSPWYAPIEAGSFAVNRQWAEDCGALWTADSPRNLANLIRHFTETGVVDTIAGFLGERPALSVGKCTLRCVPITTGTDWHQDGAFLGEKTRSVNVWLALSDCGRDSAGLDVVTRRLPYVLQTGSHGACFNWSVGPGMVDLLEQGGAAVESPEFFAGDALLFDHLMLHRTGIHPGMTKDRWAIESWFFAPSFYPLEQVPLLI